MVITSPNILYQRGIFKDDIIELICEVKFESFRVLCRRSEAKVGFGSYGRVARKTVG
jgi:hypothetical protein